MRAQIVWYQQVSTDTTRSAPVTLSLHSYFSPHFLKAILTAGRPNYRDLDSKHILVGLIVGYKSGSFFFQPLKLEERL